MQQSQRTLTVGEWSAVAAQHDGLITSGRARDGLAGLTVPCRDPRDPARPRVALLRRADGDAVPIVEGHVLAVIRSPEERRRMDGVAGAFDLDHVGEVRGLFDVHRYVSAVRGACDVGAAVCAARSSGVDAGPDHVMTLAGRIKWSDLSVGAGEGPAAHAGPPGMTSRTTNRPGRRQAWRGASDDHHPVVVVVDTGSLAAGRTDGVLDGLTGDAIAGAVIDLDPAHGTFVAGVVRQVAPEARVHVVRAFGRDGIASDTTVAIALLEAREVLMANGRRGVINLSWGCETFDERPPLATARALSLIQHDGIVVVAAAGNAGRPRPWFPAQMPGVVSVGALALDADELRGAVWSNSGDAIDVSTVGEGVVSTFMRGTSVVRAERTASAPPAWVGANPWAVWSGTSFAAPQVAGRIAQLLAVHPDEPASVVIKLLADDPSARDVEGFGVALRIL